jgi:ubiquinol-cytochrome c reductase cytochrome c1 subunit
MTSFYEDKSRPTGVNNVVLKDVGMPHVLADLQGLAKLDANGNLEPAEGSGSMSAKQYDKTALDLVNFLVYTSEPIKNYRTNLGFYVIGFLLILFVLAYLLKKEFWRDIH